MRQSSKYVLLLISLALVISGCSLIEIQNRAEPKASDTSVLGKIVREINIIGAKYTREEVVLKQLATQVGQPYTEEGADLDYAQLNALGVFSAIFFDTIDAEEEIILAINVVENVPYIPSLSLEITEENGVALGPAISYSNFLGRAWKLSGAARFGGATNAQVIFRTPWRPGSKPVFIFDFFWRNRDNKLDDFKESAFEIHLDTGWNWGKHTRFGGRLFFYSIGSDRSGVTLNPNNRDNVPGVGAFIGYDSRNIVSYPTSGWWAYADLDKFGGLIFNGDGDYWQLNLDARRFQSLGHRHRLAFYSLFTYTTGTVGTDIPIWADFHIGGTNTVRGWELGIYAGKNQWLNTLEYGFLLVEPKIVKIAFIRMDMGLQVAVFADLGTAWNTNAEFRDHLIAGAGAGVRLLMGGGFLRFDVAGGQPSLGARFHIGGRTKAEAQRFRVR